MVRVLRKCKEFGKIKEVFWGENDFKSRQNNLSQENVEIFWWPANRDKICQVVRESEKVENRWHKDSLHLEWEQNRMLSLSSGPRIKKMQGIWENVEILGYKTKKRS